MTPSVSYAWQPIGEQWGLEAKGKSNINILGLLDPIHNELHSYKVPRGKYMNSELFIEFINDFIKNNKTEEPIVLVMDNAPWHKSMVMKKKMLEWQDSNLFTIFLPPYSPQLNLIETLWRKIKHEWLCRKDYYSKNTLERKLDNIFREYNNLYNIQFSMKIFNT